MTVDESYDRIDDIGCMFATGTNEIVIDRKLHPSYNSPLGFEFRCASFVV